MIRFGPSGNDTAFYAAGYKSSADAPQWIESLGLNAYEYSFGQGVRMSDEAAAKLGEETRQYHVSVSAHAPYFVSFASDDPQKVENSFGYILSSLQKLRFMGGERCVMHTATQGKNERGQVLAQCRDRLLELAERARSAGFGDMKICPETMGKYSQIGSPEEIIDLCTADEMYVPCFDFGHINCLMQGGLNSLDVYSRILDYAFDKLPPERVRGMHVHFSKIEYGAKGELRHTTYADERFGPAFEPFAQAIIKYNLTPTVICESAEIMAQDALKLKEIFCEISASK